MNLKPDDDELNFTIHQRDLLGWVQAMYGRTVKPLIVRAIIDFITMRQRGAGTLTK
jgi:hypothetical protein